MRVLAVAIALRDARAGVQRVVHHLKEIRVGDVVRVKHAERVEFVLREQLAERAFQRLALRMHVPVHMQDARAGAPRRALGIVGTVVRHHDHRGQLLWIALADKAVHQLADYGFLVARRNERRNALARLRLRKLIFSLFQAKNGNHRVKQAVYAQQESHDRR